MSGHRRKRADKMVNAMKRILCFGDSNTWGNISGTPDRFDPEVRWTGVLQRRLGDGYLVIEEGYNGRTVVMPDLVEGRLSGIDYFRPCLDSQSPLDLVILMLGTNDLKVRFGLEAESIAFSFGRYLDALKTTPMMGDRPKVLLISPILIDESYKGNALFHGMFGEDGVSRSRALAPAYQRFAQENGLEFMDAAQYAAASPVDGIHMAAADHERLGLAVAERVRGIIG